MKTFQDLVFKKHPILKGAEKDGRLVDFLEGSRQAVIDFGNGYELSVVFGERFYSNGKDTYECMVIKDGEQYGDIHGHLTELQVTYLMAELQGYEVENEAYCNTDGSVDFTHTGKLFATIFKKKGK